MTGVEIAAVRATLNLTQVQLGQLLGVHPLTVSKWERGLASPLPHQQAMIESFAKAGQAKADVGNQAAALLMTAGVALAIFVLLKAAFDEG